MSGQLLLSRLSSEFPDCEPRLVKFVSGSFLIDLKVRGKAYVIEYVVGQGYGLSKQKGRVYGWQAVDEAYDTLAELESRVLELLNPASRPSTSVV